MFFCTYFIISACPPGNSGICSATNKGFSGSGFFSSTATSSLTSSFFSTTSTFTLAVSIRTAFLSPSTVLVLISTS
ncbi:MAG: hypothetical protein IPL33_19515 [Sphingobacteriales bacterium]|nr:hypothetical protein [Sphingobacteriales bacterium]